MNERDIKSERVVKIITLIKTCQTLYVDIVNRVNPRSSRVIVLGAKQIG